MFSFRKKALLDEAVQRAVINAIQAAEADTTGEVRVYVESHCKKETPMLRAEELFVRLGMTQTIHRNAVLIYLALKDRKFAILGDERIFSEAGGPVFWEAAALQLKDALKEGRTAEGLSSCIQEIGKALTAHFPHEAGVNKNELPDEIIFGKK